MEKLKDFRLHIVVLVVAALAELIGTQSVNIADVSIVFSPLIWAMVLVFLLYKQPWANIVGEKHAPQANAMMGMGLAILIAKLGVNSGASLEEIKEAGLALVLQNFGNLGTIFLALPICRLMGIGRESIGMSHALSREANVSLIQDTYGGQSPEFRGVMAVYIVGTIFGPIILSVLASVFTGIGLVSPIGASMGVGAGSASMMTAGLGSLVANFPELETQMAAFAGLSNLISSVIALPLGTFIGLPLTQFLYNKFWPENMKGKN